MRTLELILIIFVMMGTLWSILVYGDTTLQNQEKFS
jgi:hypothetical protein